MSKSSALLHFRVLEAKHLPAVDSNGFSDPYVKLKIGEKCKEKTTVKKETTWPVWNEVLTMVVSEELQKDNLEISVWDYNKTVNKIIANCVIKVQTLKEEKASSKWYQLVHPSTGKILPSAQVRISIVWDLQHDGNAWALANEKRGKLLKDLWAQRDAQLTEITEKEDAALMEDAKKREFLVHVVTWNVGNAPIPDDLDGLLPKENKFDIISVGVQECKYKPRKGFKTCMADFIGSFSAHLDKEFVLLAEAPRPSFFEMWKTKGQMWQIRQLVFVRKEIRNLCSDIRVMTEATGIAHVFPNKGATCVTFSINDLSLAFVNCHLAAHQDKVERRNADVAEIIEGIINEEDNQKMDISSAYHHVFWNGDLNYRLDYGDQGLEREPSAEQFKEMTEMVTAKKYEELFATDQLSKAMEEKKVFIGWSEGKMNFAPTFKVARSEKLEYNQQRSPAWCDRILWKSLSSDFPLRQTDIGARLSVATSDHKPVYATFAMRDYQLPCSSTARKKKQCFLKITNLKAKFLPSGDIINGLSDPYIQFRAPFIINGKAKTAHVKATLNPEWDDKDVPYVELTINNPERLAMSRVFVRMFDWDRLKQDDFLCSGSLFLGPALKGETDFVVPLLKGGLPAGEITGKYQLQWPALEF